jgi:uncharacterized protein YqgV (UPF0045/DUF77 family)
MHSAGTTLGTSSQCNSTCTDQKKKRKSDLSNHISSKRQITDLTLHVSTISPFNANFPTEGSWDEVMRVIGQAHCLLHANGVVRIQSDIRVGSRTDKKQKAADKVAKVEQLLAQDEKEDEPTAWANHDLRRDELTGEKKN